MASTTAAQPWRPDSARSAGTSSGSATDPLSRSIRRARIPHTRRRTSRSSFAALPSPRRRTLSGFPGEKRGRSSPVSPRNALVSDARSAMRAIAGSIRARNPMGPPCGTGATRRVPRGDSRATVTSRRSARRAGLLEGGLFPAKLSSAFSLSQHILRDDDALDLGRSLADLEELHVPEETLDRILPGEAVPSQDLHRFLRDPVRRLGSDEL